MSGKKRGFRWRRFPPLQFLIYLLLRVGIMVLDMFPYGSASTISRFLARLFRLVDRRRFTIAVNNLRLSGLMPEEKISTFLDRVYDHFALGLVEMMMAHRLMKHRPPTDFVKFERFDVLEGILREGKGALVAIGHLGNWELIGLAVSKAGYTTNSLARPVENPWVDRYVDGFRTQAGQKIISKYNALSAMVRTLQRNETLIVQVDQDARKVGVFVDFFGRPASTHRSPATLSLKYGTPIVVANIYREGGMHHCVVSDPIRPAEFRNGPDPVRSLTQAYTTRLEECVREHPEQWLWMHGRWKTPPPTAPVDAEAVATPKG